jgi:hypothetical protein
MCDVVFGRLPPLFRNTLNPYCRHQETVVVRLCGHTRSDKGSQCFGFVRDAARGRSRQVSLRTGDRDCVFSETAPCGGPVAGRSKDAEFAAPPACTVPEARSLLFRWLDLFAGTIA